MQSISSLTKSVVDSFPELDNKPFLEALEEKAILVQVKEGDTVAVTCVGVFASCIAGIGTLEEIIEMMTWAQLGRHEKPMGFLDVNSFWKPLFELMDHMKSSGFLHTASKIRPVISDDPAVVVKLLQNNNTDKT